MKVLDKILVANQSFDLFYITTVKGAEVLIYGVKFINTCRVKIKIAKPE